MFYLVKYATPTVNIIVIGTELEKNSDIMNSDVIRTYFSKIRGFIFNVHRLMNRLMYVDEEYSVGTQILRRNQVSYLKDPIIKNELALFEL